MAVEAAQLDDLSVERKAVIGERGFAKADAAAIFVNDLASLQETNVNSVEIGVVEIP